MAVAPNPRGDARAFGATAIGVRLELPAYPVVNRKLGQSIATRFARQPCRRARITSPSGASKSGPCPLPFEHDKGPYHTQRLAGAGGLSRWNKGKNRRLGYVRNDGHQHGGR